MASTALSVVDKLYSNKTVALSNALAQSRQKTNLLESKLEFLAIYRLGEEMQERKRTDAKGNLYTVHYVDISAAEIRQLIGSRSGRLYEQIETAALELKQKLYIYKDETKNQFAMQNLYGEVSYDGGKLSIEFNPATEFLFTQLASNYTKYRLNICFKFKSTGGFMLYKILKTHTYVLPEVDMALSQEQQESITKEFSLADFRLQMGYVNLNQPDIKQEGSKIHPDPEKMVELEKKPKYKRWQDFYARVVEPGIKEINEISDIYISSVVKRCSAHGKVESVLITVQNNKDFAAGTSTKTEKKAPPKKLTESEQMDFADEMRTFISEPLKTSQLVDIARAAEFDLDVIRKAYEVAKSSPRDNLVGFMLAAIKNDYEMPVSTEKADKNKNSFHTFEQREYSEEYYDELERKKLKK